MWHQCLKSLTSSLSHVGRCRLLGWVCVTIVTNACRLCLTWLRIDHNGIGVIHSLFPLKL
ncbi:unnamed protein product [Schistosoma mattheei]|uniref:Uncharacterized protein n=1 Tax=Schistosoma mattheei TaxID=31246 RepID=A0A183NE11_9TREM|nr:unnamed protein product [Schistosoma mattheei]